MHISIDLARRTPAHSWERKQWAARSRQPATPISVMSTSMMRGVLASKNLHRLCDHSIIDLSGRVSDCGDAKATDDSTVFEQRYSAGRGCHVRERPVRVGGVRLIVDGVLKRSSGTTPKCRRDRLLLTQLRATG